jgi:hypothetical protein
MSECLSTCIGNETADADVPGMEESKTVERCVDEYPIRVGMFAPKQRRPDIPMSKHFVVLTNQDDICKEMSVFGKRMVTVETSAEDVPRPLSEYLDAFKVVYCRPTKDYSHVMSTVCILCIRMRVGATHVYHSSMSMSPSGVLAVCDLSKDAQYALNEGFVTCARFIDIDVEQANRCAEEYKKGNVVLIPQIVAHNIGIPPMKYEVGALVGVTEAGEPGLNGCVKGIHVHMDEQAAVDHAVQMSVQNIQNGDAPLTTILSKRLEVKDEPWSRLQWKRWNPSKTRWPVEDTTTTCAACARELGGRRFVSMTCGHGLFCGECADLQRETMTCVICDVDTVRIASLEW